MASQKYPHDIPKGPHDIQKVSSWDPKRIPMTFQKDPIASQKNPHDIPKGPHSIPKGSLDGKFLEIFISYQNFRVGNLLRF